MDDAKSVSTMSSSGTKRKRMSPGFYAVKAGKTPGVYYSWSDVLEQITGYKNAVHKKFNTLSEAEAFLNDDPNSGKGSTQKYYAVQSGRVPGVYTDWPSAQAQITGWKGVKHKRFDTRAEAEAFVAAGKGIAPMTGNSTNVKDNDLESEASLSDARKGCKVSDSVSKKQKKNDGSAVLILGDDLDKDVEPGTGLLPPDAEDGFDDRIILNPVDGTIEYKTEHQMNATKLQPTGEIKGPIIIYTDGSSRGNGKVGAVAGVGVYFGAGDDRNVSERLQGPRQTNQRAELTAIQRAVDIAPIDVDIEIYSDSKYGISCVTEWFKNWRRNGWKTASGKTVDNRDIIEPILERIDMRKLAKANTKFVWVRGHANDPGNEAADKLAVAGAQRSMGSVPAVDGEI
ncbi:ribonuclease H-like protein [Delitschia confertaspora ATCC 74209]|uniref:Ribonuclease H n=1 Tax=Delitschia confertaspora ATCC 74209 TaxID=1513339 RepID=A0A9P4JVT6_9PLEO|nr:ribonuclease H-like protein [Delitschia confertaspora ATCC 74209]